MLKFTLLALASALAFGSALPVFTSGRAAAETAMNCGALPLAAAYPAERVLVERKSRALPPPALSAKAAVVIDAATGKVLYGINEHERRSPASTTKILTGIIGIEEGDLNEVHVSRTDARKLVGSSVMGLRPGQRISLEDLLYGLMLPSGNDAAVEIARAIDGDVPAFVERMNEKVAELGLKDTNFSNPHGLDSRRHYSTAHDLAQIGRYAMANPTFARISNTRVWSLSSPEYDLYNGNSLLGSPGVDGIKIGWTPAAGWTFVSSAERDGRRLIVTVLNSDDRNADAAALFDWAYASHEWVGLSAKMSLTLRVAARFNADDNLMKTIAACV